MKDLDELWNRLNAIDDTQEAFRNETQAQRSVMQRELRAAR